jgi:hypothetical protein
LSTIKRARERDMTKAENEALRVALGISPAGQQTPDVVRPTRHRALWEGVVDGTTGDAIYGPSGDAEERDGCQDYGSDDERQQNG